MIYSPDIRSPQLPADIVNNNLSDEPVSWLQANSSGTSALTRKIMNLRRSRQARRPALRPCRAHLECTPLCAPPLVPPVSAPSEHLLGTHEYESQKPTAQKAAAQRRWRAAQ